MSTRVPDAPTYSNPVVVGTAVVGDHYEGKFSANWLGWLLAQNRAVQDLQASIPISISAFGPVAGPGPITMSMNVTMRRTGTLNIIANVIQFWQTAPPPWEITITVDATIYSTGVMSNAWQSVISPMVQVGVGPGLHTVSITWRTGDSNGSALAITMDVFPAYTS